MRQAAGASGRHFRDENVLILGGYGRYDAVGRKAAAAATSHPDTAVVVAGRNPDRASRHPRHDRGPPGRCRPSALATYWTEVREASCHPPPKHAYLHK